MQHAPALDISECRRFSELDLANTFAITSKLNGDLEDTTWGVADYDQCLWSREGDFFGNRKTEVPAWFQDGGDHSSELAQFMLGNLYYSEDQECRLDILLDMAARRRVEAAKNFLSARAEEFQRRKFELLKRYDE